LSHQPAGRARKKGTTAGIAFRRPIWKPVAPTRAKQMVMKETELPLRTPNHAMSR
jgi:hypothetical protein